MIGSSHSLEHQGPVSHSTCHRPGMVEAPTKGDDASPTNAAVCRLEPDNAAERGGVTDGTTGIATGGERDQMRCQCCTRSRTGAAWKHGCVPRVARYAKDLHAAGSEFNGIEFAEADGPGVPQARSPGAVLRRHVASHDLRSCRGW